MGKQAHRGKGGPMKPPKLSLSDSQKQDLEDLFELFDTDGGGTLDEDEIKIALLTLGFFNTTEEEVEEYVRHLDVEEKGGLNLEQFVMLVTEKVSNRNLRKELKSAFDWMTKASGASVHAVQRAGA